MPCSAVAASGQFPFMAALFRNRLVDKAQNLYNFCGGSLIASNVVMTAGEFNALRLNVPTSPASMGHSPALPAAERFPCLPFRAHQPTASRTALGL